MAIVWNVTANKQVANLRLVTSKQTMHQDSDERKRFSRHKYQHAKKKKKHAKYHLWAFKLYNFEFEVNLQFLDAPECNVHVKC